VSDHDVVACVWVLRDGQVAEGIIGGMKGLPVMDRPGGTRQIGKVVEAWVDHDGDEPRVMARMRPEPGVPFARLLQDAVKDLPRGGEIGDHGQHG
jgi:hypothetical protein